MFDIVGTWINLLFYMYNNEINISIISDYALVFILVGKLINLQPTVCHSTNLIWYHRFMIQIILLKPFLKF